MVIANKNYLNYPELIKFYNPEDLRKPFFITNENSIRDFMSAENVSKIIANLCVKNITSPVNIGSGIETKISSFVNSISKRKITIVTDNKKSYYVADVSKLNKLINV